MKDEEEEFESDEDRKNDEWLKDNFFDLIDKYPREWIAVLEQKVIAKGSTRTEVEKMAEEIIGDRECSVYFIPPTGTFMDVGYCSR
jgi:hypothetical protein